MADDSSENKKQLIGSHDASRRRFLKGVGIAGAGAALADQLLIEAPAQETKPKGAVQSPFCSALRSKKFFMLDSLATDASQYLDEQPLLVS